MLLPTERSAELVRDIVMVARGKDLEDAPALHIVPRERLEAPEEDRAANPMPPDVASPAAAEAGDPQAPSAGDDATSNTGKAN